MAIETRCRRPPALPGRRARRPPFWVRFCSCASGFRFYVSDDEGDYESDYEGDYEIDYESDYENNDAT